MRLILTSVLIFISTFSSTFAQEVKHVPQWAKKAVWYQIFPERFRNGNLDNDPALKDIQGSWPHQDTSAWKCSPWTSDWYQLQPWEEDEHDFYYHSQRRRYGGDLEGVMHQIPYLKSLGINAIYFNPLFEAPSLHKYDGASYHHIDDNFGPDPEGDRLKIAQENPQDPSTWVWTSADSLFIALVKSCHDHGIRVIIDGVFNHIGLRFWAFEDLVKNQQQSKYKDWFIVKKWDNPSTKKNEFDYKGWYGVKELPELYEDENGFHPDAWAYIQHAVRRWMDPDGDGDPSDGIDGWRLDVAEQVDFPVWDPFCAYVRSINPQAYIVGEVWWEEWPHKMFNAAPWLQPGRFDAVMNYRWSNLVQHWMIDRKNKITATEFETELKQLRDDYPADVNYVLLNLMDSHDTDRLASNIINPDLGYDAKVDPKGTRNYDVRKPNTQEIRIQKLIALFQMTYVGAPCLYYGTEAGMWGADDPDERKPMVWPDMVYEDETTHPFGHDRPVDKVAFNYDLFHYYQRVIHLRKSNIEFSLGDFQKVMTDDTRDVLAFTRNYQTNTSLVVLNNSSQVETISIPQAGCWKDFQTGMIYRAVDGHLNLTIPNKAGIVLKKESH